MFTFRKTWLHINLRFTLCFKWLAQGQPWKRVPTYGQPLCRTVVLKKNLSCTSYHCVRLFAAVKYSLPPSRTMCKCSALNSGASLNRGRKFITGIPSRHESCQKIRHIPVRHISTPSTCTGTRLKWGSKILCALSFGCDLRAWERCRVTLHWDSSEITLSIGHRPKPQTQSLLLAKSHILGKS